MKKTKYTIDASPSNHELNLELTLATGAATTPRPTVNPTATAANSQPAGRSAHAAPHRRPPATARARSPLGFKIPRHHPSSSPPTDPWGCVYHPTLNPHPTPRVSSPPPSSNPPLSIEQVRAIHEMARIHYHANQPNLNPPKTVTVISYHQRPLPQKSSVVITSLDEEHSSEKKNASLDLSVTTKSKEKEKKVDMDDVIMTPRSGCTSESFESLVTSEEDVGASGTKEQPIVIKDGAGETDKKTFHTPKPLMGVWVQREPKPQHIKTEAERELKEAKKDVAVDGGMLPTHYE